jgi:hypothetical protein
MKKKSILRILLFIGLLLLTMIFVVMAVKPGAAIFFAKKGLSPDKAELTEELIRFPITLSNSFYDVDTLLVRENGQLLPHIKIEQLPGRTEPAFAVETLGADEYLIRVIPQSTISEGMDLSSLEILVRPHFVTQPWVKVLAILLGFGFFLSIVSILSSPDSRRKIGSKLFGIFQIWDEPVPFLTNVQQKAALFPGVMSQAGFVAFFFVSMEWLFFVTKPSFMDLLPFGQKLGILFISSLILWFAIALLVVLIFILDLLFNLFAPPFTDIVYRIPAAFVLTGSALLLFDNFTYTVFSFGISTTTNWLRFAYVLGFILAFITIIRYLTGKPEADEFRIMKKVKAYSLVGLLALAVLFLIIQYDPIVLQSGGETGEGGYRTPNIILVSDDGLNAENMSLYGYERETTPFLDSLASTSLLMLNNFTNANTSAGSDTALLTGKSPFDTRVMYAPNTLVGSDALEHLPGILKRLGFQTMSIGIPQFVDMGMINFQNGFDSINGETSGLSRFVSFASAYGYNDPAYFFSTIVTRLTDRLQHISYLGNMANAYEMVTDVNPTTVSVNMSGAYDILIDSLDKANGAGQPLFAHIHMIGTHGAMFYPLEQVYSEGQEQTTGWMTDFYDDAIMDYDRWLENLVTYLIDNGYYDDTLIVFYTDHAEQWSTERRIPLMIHFPNDANSGEISENTQNLDIAPTILDYVGMDTPEWMVGQSLLDELPRDRLIFMAEINPDAFGRDGDYEDVISPPFYQFATVNVAQCQYLYSILLDDGVMIRKTVPAYVNPCQDELLDGPDQIWDTAMAFLVEYGFRIPSGWEDPVLFEIE